MQEEARATLQASTRRTSSAHRSLRDHSRELPGIGVLLEGGKLAVSNPPYVANLCIELLGAARGAAPVSTFNDDGLASVVEGLHLDLELVEVDRDASEHVCQNGGGPVVTTLLVPA